MRIKTNQKICPHLTEETYKRRFEGNINDWEEPHNSHTESCKHDIDFFTEYLPRMKGEVRIFPGMEKVIADLEREYTLIIISSTLTAPIKEFLQRYNLANYFTEIMGNDVHKSKVEKIKKVFEKYNVDAKDCIFITDTLGDIREARKMEIDAIGVTWGFHLPETLLQGKPIELVEKSEEILTSVAAYFKK